MQAGAKIYSLCMLHTINVRFKMRKELTTDNMVSPAALRSHARLTPSAEQCVRAQYASGRSNASRGAYDRGDRHTGPFLLCPLAPNLLSPCRSLQQWPRPESTASRLRSRSRLMTAWRVSSRSRASGTARCTSPESEAFDCRLAAAFRVTSFALHVRDPKMATLSLCMHSRLSYTLLAISTTAHY